MVIIAVRDEIRIPFAFSLVYVICISKGVRSLCFVQGKSTFGQKTVWSEGFSFVQRDSTSHMRTLSAEKKFKKQVNYTYYFLKNHPELLFFWEREILSTLLWFPFPYVVLLPSEHCTDPLKPFRVWDSFCLLI